jgi:hypothetical protein
MGDKRVVNLSSYELTEDEISVLSKCLKLCLMPDSTDPGEIRQDLDKLHKRLQQIAFFDKPEESIAGSQSTQIVLPERDFDLGDNLSSIKPFKHRKFKLPSKGKGPVGPLHFGAHGTM